VGRNAPQLTGRIGGARERRCISPGLLSDLFGATSAERTFPCTVAGIAIEAKPECVGFQWFDPSFRAVFSSTYTVVHSV
jgi:hypothetical protein